MPDLASPRVLSLRERALIGDVAAPGGRSVQILPNEDVRAFADKLEGVERVTLVLGKHAEGRPYTQARILREELGFRGTLRATGAVYRDLLFFLWRCGVDEVVLADPAEEDEALASRASFSVRYQGAADEPLPLWRRSRR